jgi:hypothetical protein
MGVYTVTSDDERIVPERRVLVCRGGSDARRRTHVVATTPITLNNQTWLQAITSQKHGWALREKHGSRGLGAPKAKKMMRKLRVLLSFFVEVASDLSPMMPFGAGLSPRLQRDEFCKKPSPHDALEERKLTFQEIKQKISCEKK